MEPLLLFLQTHPTAVQQTKGAGAHILPRLASLLRHGCHGAAPTVASALMPLASLLPPELTQPTPPSSSTGSPTLAPAAILLTAVYDGLSSGNPPAAHFRPLLKAHSDILLLLVATASKTPSDPSAAANDLLAAGIGVPLASLLNGTLPPRLSELIATESISSSIVSLASSSKCTEHLDAYLPTVVQASP